MKGHSCTRLVFAVMAREAFLRYSSDKVDPSGSFFGWKASAIGKHSISAKTFLEKRYFSQQDMGLEDAIHTAILTLKENFEGAITAENIEIGIISSKDKTFKAMSKDEITDFLTEVE